MALFDDGRLLFFDHELIGCMQEVGLTMNPPIKRGGCLHVEREWELGGTRPLCIVEWQGVYRLYYKVNLGKRTTLAFVTSTDGIHWERPELGVVKFKGSSKNNLVDIGDQHPNEVCVFIDPTGPDEHRFKLVGHSQQEGGMYAMTSPDGLRFTRVLGHLLPFITDNHKTAFYDERIGKYVIYLRGWDRNRPIHPMDGSRVVMRAETDDILKPLAIEENAPNPWPQSKKLDGTGSEGLRRLNRELPIVLSCDDSDPPNADLYQAAAVQYLPEAYVAFPSLYYWYPWPPEGFVNDGVLDLQFAHSRDGIHWRRNFRGAYVRLDLPDGPCTKMMHMLVGMVPNGFCLSQYYVGGRRSHGEGRVKTETKFEKKTEMGDPMIFRLEQRMDGFVSADSAYTGGMLVTNPFELKNKTLRINIDTSASGDAYAALVGEDSSAIEGFELRDSDRIQGNNTEFVLSWKGNDDLSQFVGKKIKLLIKSRHAKLFAVYT